MRLKRLWLNDYRGFGGATLEFAPHGPTVLAGPNGCGKSSALDALASLLSAVPFVLTGTKASWFGGGDVRNIRSGAGSARWGLNLDEDGPEAVGWSLGAYHENNHRSVAPDPPKLGSVGRLAEALAAVGGAADVPVLAYFHSGSTRARDRHAEHEDRFVDRFVAYRGAFNQESAHFADFERWYEQEENLENEHRLRKASLKHQIPTLKAVRDALTTFLGALQARSLGAFRVVRAHVGGPLSAVQGRLTIEKGDDALFLDQLSDGERRLILLVGDVARRMAVLNPHAANPTAGPGVVLVDEVELHLHPGWQRRVMPALCAAFPGVQFVVSTHSPQVLASVPSESVRLLDKGTFLPGHPRVRGRDSNTLLESVFGVGERPEEVKQRLQALYDALEDHPDRARGLYDALRDELEGDDPELARIETLLALVGG